MPPLLRLHVLVSPAPPPPPLMQKEIVLAYECPATHDPDACTHVYSGLLTKGLFVAVESFTHLFVELVETRGLAHGNFTIVQVRVVCVGLPYKSRCVCPASHPPPPPCISQC